MAGGGNDARRTTASLKRRTRVGYERGDLDMVALNLAYSHASEEACRARYAGALE